MTDITRLTIGYIPATCKADWIAPGDPENSETVEQYIELQDFKFYLTFGLGVKKDDDTVLPISYDDLWNPSSKMWKLFVDKVCNQLSKGVSSLNPITLGKSWSFFCEEGDIPDGSFVVKYDLETGGDLENKKEYCDGNHWYINYTALEVDKENEEIISKYFIVINSKIR